LRVAQVRITVATVSCFIVVLLVGVAVVLAMYRRDLVEQVDAQLRDASEQVAMLADVQISVPADATVEDRVQLVADDGQVLFGSEPLEADQALWTPGEPTEPHTVSSERVGSLRVTATPFRGAWLVFAEPMEPIEQNVEALRNTMLIALPAMLLALALVTWLAVGRALRPVAAAVEREEQLLADVSHELRSPIAGMRVLLETTPVDATDALHDRRDALAALARLETITDQLMQITRRDDASGTHARPVDLDEVVQRTAQRLPATAREIDLSQVEAGQVVGVEHELESVVENLLANATRHASTVVRVTLAEADGSTTMTVEDDGPGIPPDDRARVFERFARLDEARTRDAGGAGLGLAIVEAIVDAHGGSVVVDDSPLGGARFVVKLPASTCPDAVIAHPPDHTASVGKVPASRPPGEATRT
jgi:signal transduction histidine kinase